MFVSLCGSWLHRKALLVNTELDIYEVAAVPCVCFVRLLSEVIKSYPFILLNRSP